MLVIGTGRAVHLVQLQLLLRTSEIPRARVPRMQSGRGEQRKC